MAALVKHEPSLKGLKIVIKWAQVAMMGKKYTVKKPKDAIKPKLKPKPGPSFDSSAQSLATRGFLRPYKGYTPSDNAQKHILAISNQVFGSTRLDIQLTEPKQRFQFLHACWKHTGHAVPNSLLYTMECVGDVVNFYNTPVNTNTPLDMMKKKELPPNLHILYEYKRFDPDPNNVFSGQSAFPESSTLVTGLKSQKKYKGYEAKPPVHDWLKLANWPYPPPKQ